MCLCVCVGFESLASCFSGRILENGKTLSSIGFKSGNTVHLVVKNPSAAAPATSTPAAAAPPLGGMGGLGAMFGGANPVCESDLFLFFEGISTIFKCCLLLPSLSCSRYPCAPTLDACPRKAQPFTCTWRWLDTAQEPLPYSRYFDSHPALSPLSASFF